ncbi:MAG: DivIVA domain-containing protein [Gemmatimonadota bacterium]
MTDDAFHLTALDVRRYDFGNALRGYDRARVDQFRDQVAEELERLSRANQELDLKARSFHEQLKAFRDRDKALNEALVSAQQLRGEIRQQAEREAQLILREAGAEAERQLQQVQSDVRRAEEELQALWRARRNFLTGLRHNLERQLGELNAAESEPMPSFGTLREAGATTPSQHPQAPSSQAQPRAQGSRAQGGGDSEPPRIAPRTVPGQSPFSAPMASGNEAELPELRELRELPPRNAAPTPSWLDVVDDG